MAKQKFITRTMKSTRVSILCVDTQTAETFNKIVLLSGTFKNEDEILKQAKKTIETGSIKAVDVAASQIEQGLYRMPEDVFLANAEKVEK